MTRTAEERMRSPFRNPFSLTHAVAPILLLCASGTAAQTPTYDLSGLPIFWELASVLERDGEPTDDQWARLLEHPGYAQIERQGQRGAAVRTCIPLVFRPSMRAQLAEAIEDGNMRVQRVCSHLEDVRKRRDELRAFEAQLADANELQRAVQMTAPYLPDGAIDGEPPAVYVILFEQNGFGGASLALDQLFLMNTTEELRLGYLAHEFHHAFRSRVDRVWVEREDPDYLLVAAVSSLAEEGIASLLDKRDWLDADYVANLDGQWREVAETFAELYGASEDAMAELDARLAAVARGEVTAKEAGPEIKSGLPWGGHPTGMYMALAIESTFGRAELAALSADPLEFILRYHDAAMSSEDFYRISDESVAYLEELSERH